MKIACGGLTTGISFIKPYWNFKKGRAIGERDGRIIHEGDVDCCVVSLFELKFDTCSKMGGYYMDMP